MVMAAPAPISPRQAMSGPTLPEKAAPSEPLPKTASPARKSRLRPYRSATLPATSSSPPKTME